MTKRPAPGWLRAGRTLAVLGLAVAMSACIPGTPTSPSLAGVELVVAASAQDSDLDLALVKGAVLLHGTAGTTRIETDGMDSTKLVRVRDSVAFSDKRADYLLGSSLAKVSRGTEATFQVGAVSAPNGDVTAVFNQGFDDPGYRTDVVRYNATASHLTTHAGSKSLPWLRQELGDLWAYDFLVLEPRS